MKNRGRREDRVSTDTHGPRAVKKARGRNHRLSRDIRPSLREWCYGLYVLSPGTGLSCPRDRADVISATYRQRRGDRTTRFHRPLQRRSSARKNRARRQSGHRIPASRIVTIGRNVPLCRGGMREWITYFRKTEAENFSPTIWTEESALNRFRNFEFWRKDSGRSERRNFSIARHFVARRANQLALICAGEVVGTAFAPVPGSMQN
jgi:hypothetical protein